MENQPESGADAGATILLGGSGEWLEDLLVPPSPHQAPRRFQRVRAESRDWCSAWAPGSVRSAVYSGGSGDRRRPGPDLEEAKGFFEGCLRLAVARVVVVSSAAVYEPSAHHPGMVGESHPLTIRTGNRIASRWRELEDLAERTLEGIEALTILRPAIVLQPGGEDYFSRLFRARCVVRLAGHDPTLQVLSRRDLARAVESALESDDRGRTLRHLAPGGAIPLRKALAFRGVRSLPAPRTVQRPVRWLLSKLGLAFPIDQLDYVRYGWTLKDLRVSRAESSLAALAEYSGRVLEPADDGRFDDFGMDRDTIRRLGKSVFRFLHDVYWRVEIEGIENIPRQGAGVLVGVHRGFMPFDGVMALHELATLRERLPRFLIHPGLVKFPFFHDFITKMGGVPACRQNADRILESGGILGVFPEGVRGAFSMYSDAYRLKKFGRLDFVRFAIRRQVPILPFVTVGGAETFPILARIDSEWWRRHAEWPFFPITPTFPWLPVPLPSKWRTRYLEPIHVERTHPPEAADDPAAVREIGRAVRQTMQRAIDELLARRRSVFFG